LIQPQQRLNTALIEQAGAQAALLPALLTVSALLPVCAPACSINGLRSINGVCAPARADRAGRSAERAGRSAGCTVISSLSSTHKRDVLKTQPRARETETYGSSLLKSDLLLKRHTKETSLSLSHTQKRPTKDTAASERNRPTKSDLLLKRHTKETYKATHKSEASH